MPDFTGSASVVGSTPMTVAVEIHLDTETISLWSGGVEIGSWPLAEARLRADEHNELHLHVEGEEMILHTNDDARLAVAMGLRSAPPLLRRQMAAVNRPVGTDS